LEDREWIRSDKEGFRLMDPSALLNDWAVNYDIRRNSIFEFYSLKSVPEIEGELAEFCSRESIIYALTGFSGGARYASAVRYQRVTAYIQDDAIANVAKALKLKQVSSGANVSLISPKDRNIFYGSQFIDSACIASTSQLYLDLRSLHARGDEAAEALLRRKIEPTWQ